MTAAIIPFTGGLFPILDGDFTLTPAGTDASRLALAGVYRPPLGRLGARLDTAVLHKVADATIIALLHTVADAFTSPAKAPQPGPGTRVVSCRGRSTNRARRDTPASAAAEGKPAGPRRTAG